VILIPLSLLLYPANPSTITGTYSRIHLVYRFNVNTEHPLSKFLNVLWTLPTFIKTKASFSFSQTSPSFHLQGFISCSRYFPSRIDYFDMRRQYPLELIFNAGDVRATEYQNINPLLLQGADTLSCSFLNYVRIRYLPCSASRRRSGQALPKTLAFVPATWNVFS